MSVNLSHISKSFGSQQVLRDVSLRIEPGEVIGLLGPNGAGKSTLMKIMLGLWHADSGVVESPTTHGYLPEQNPLYTEMYVREYLLFMARLEHLPSVDMHARVEELIDQVGLRAEVHKRIGALSKGYRQRVGLAQALLGDPGLLVLDEPTTGLDPRQLDEIRALIRALSTTSASSQQGRIIILSTHILQEVREMCSRVVILNHGEVRADLPMAEIQDLEALFRDATR